MIELLFIISGIGLGILLSDAKATVRRQGYQPVRSIKEYSKPPKGR